MNKLRGTLNACAVKAPGFAIAKRPSSRDIAILTGGQACWMSADTSRLSTLFELRPHHRARAQEPLMHPERLAQREWRVSMTDGSQISTQCIPIILNCFGVRKCAIACAVCKGKRNGWVRQIT